MKRVTGQCPSDCGDNSCLCAGPDDGGVRTNGGCRCTPMEIRYALMWWKRYAKQLAHDLHTGQDSDAKSRTL